MDKAKKKRLKRYITWACMAAVVVLLTAMPLLAKKEVEAEGPQASVLSVQVESGSVTASLHGGGTLQTMGEEAVNLPSGVKITEFLVSNGDYVTKGTPVAAVDKVSVMSAITQVSETMEYLREELEDARDEKADSAVKAVPGGRVKKIFAREGEAVQEVMLRDGCLALLSIDGLMAVKIENTAQITTGEGVTVQFSDGTEAAGRVESNLDGVKIITLEDEGYEIGGIVQISAADGEILGSGSLYVHNAWKATAYAGTVSKIHAEEEDTLSQGGKLFTLEDTEYTGQLQHRANQHREYEALLQRLLKMHQTGTIDAPCDGIVSGVDSRSTHLLSAQEDWEGNYLNSESGGYRVVLLSSVPQEPCSRTQDCKAENHEPDCPQACTGDERCGADQEHHKPDCIRLCTHADAPEGCTAQRHYPDCIHSCVSASAEGACKATKHYLTCIESCISGDGTKDCPATKTHRCSCIERCSHAAVTGICEASAHHYRDCVESCISSTDKSTPCPSGKHKAGCYFGDVVYTAYAAKVFGAGTSALVVFRGEQPYQVEFTGNGWEILGGRLDPSLLVVQDVIPAANAGQFQSGDIILMVTGYKGEEAVSSEVALYQRTGGSSGIPGMGGITGGFDFGSLMGGLSGMTGGFSGFGNYSGLMPQEEEEGLYDLEGSTLLTVTPQDTMTLTITQDEKDIAKIQPGMKATVKVEALRGQTFPAVVTKVGTTGANSGGSSKFTVELTLDMVENMISGMSATAQLPLDTRENVPVIPVAALSERNGKAVVYTAVNQETGEPESMASVQTGLSDGEKVEILSGLSLGDTVYYSYYDILELDTSAEAERFTFG